MEPQSPLSPLFSDSQLPRLSSTEITILGLLADEPNPLVGSEIRGKTGLKLGTVYATLQRMVDKSYLDRVDATGHSDTERPKVFYLTTEYGRRIIDAYRSAIDTFSTGKDHTAK